MNAQNHTTTRSEQMSATGFERAHVPSDPGRRRVLSLDDSEEILGLLRACWEEAGYEPWTTDDEAAALCLLCFSEQIDLFTEDLDRPGAMGGLELLRMIRSHPRLRKIPVLIISAYPLATVRQMMEAAGLELEQTVSGYLRKPFTAGELAAKAKTILAGGKSFELGSIPPIEITDLALTAPAVGRGVAEAGLVSALGDLAHDFNNLLTVIRGRAQIALEEASTPAEVIDSLQQILTATDRAVILTRQLARLR